MTRTIGHTGRVAEELKSVVADGNIALIGDASHPLSGAFGAGAGFALEDAYVLGQSLQWSYINSRPLSGALDLFDKVRSPHYKNLYDVLDGFARIGQTLDDPHMNLSFDEDVAVLVSTNWAHRHNWIYHYDVQAVFRDAASTYLKPSIPVAKL